MRADHVTGSNPISPRHTQLEPPGKGDTLAACGPTTESGAGKTGNMRSHNIAHEWRG